MVRKIEKNEQQYYRCEECDFAYAKEQLAQKCEAWCREHHSCNMEITKHAVEL